MKAIAPETTPQENMMRAIQMPRADFVHDDVRGHFEQKIGQEEDARAEAERGLGEA